jgi:sterol desaturase/sphingolipid hydroxylase (fatty acid hydroxylase superfamily)
MAQQDGLRLKKINAAVSLSFLIPAVLLGLLYPASPALWAVSFALGFLWANLFEYFYHRWLDHTPGCYFEKKHRTHHKDPEDDEAVNLGNGWETFGMFVVNSVPVVAASLWSGVHFAAPVMAAFVAYVLTTEEAHWRVHMGGWVPAWVRRYHLSHHGRGAGATGGNTKFNIFLPIFDWVFGTIDG